MFTMTTGDEHPRNERIVAEIDGDCQWFLFCYETAVDQRDHPILGRVPVCAQHKVKP